jgi:signal transduction histidine kinase
MNTSQHADESNHSLIVEALRVKSSSPDSAARLFDGALLHARESKNPSLEAEALYQLGVIAFERGELDKVARYAAEAAAAAKLQPNEALVIKCRQLSGLILLRTADFGKAQLFFTDLLADARRIKDKKGIAVALNYLGTCYAERGDFRTATNHYQQSLVLIKESGYEQMEAVVLNNLANVHYDISNYPKALEAYHAALLIYRRRADISGETLILGNLANVYIQTADYARAIEYLEATLSICQKFNNTYRIAIVLNNLGRVQELTGNLTNAAELYRQSADAYLSTSDQKGYALAITNYASALKSLNDLVEAEKALVQSLNIQRTIGDPYGEADTLLVFARLKLQSADYDNALTMLNLAHAIAAEQGRQSLLYEVHRTFSEVYHAQKNFEKAYQHHVIHSKIKDQIYSEENAKTLFRLQVGFQVEESNQMAKSLGERATQLSEANAALSGVLYELESQREHFKSGVNQLQSLIANLQQGVMLQDEHGKTLLVNQMFCNLFGLPMSPAMLSSVDDALVRQYLAKAFGNYDKFELRLNEILKRRQIIIGEELHLTDKRTFSRQYIPVFVENVYKGHVWLYEDITAQKKSQVEREEVIRELEVANENLIGANMFKGEMLGIAAHDLKNPLQSIMGFVQLAMLEEPPPNIENYQKEIYKASEQMLGIITSLLKSTQLEVGKLELNKQETDIAQLASAAVGQNRGSAELKRIQLIITADEGCVSDVDPDRMKEIIDNLVGNAIKYSPSDKSIWVRVYRHQPANADDVLRISVRDEGQGLTDEDKKKLFGMFQRLSAKPTGNESSTGLGLSIVKQLVELHGGKVWADSDGKNKGAEFIVELPLSLVAKEA